MVSLRTGAGGLSGDRSGRNARRKRRDSAGVCRHGSGKDTLAAKIRKPHVSAAAHTDPRRRRRSRHRQPARALPEEGRLPPHAGRVGPRRDAADQARHARPGGARPDAAGTRRPAALPRDPRRRQHRGDSDHHADGEGRRIRSHRRPRAGRRRLHHQAVQPERSGGARPRAAAPRASRRAGRQPAVVRHADGRRRSPRRQGRAATRSSSPRRNSCCCST